MQTKLRLSILSIAIMRTKLAILAFALLLAPSAWRAQGGSPADEKAIRDIEAQWEAAWNRHDVAAMAANYAPDSDAINLAGEWFKGRAAFVNSLEELHSDKVKGSVWQTEQTNIRFLTPEIVVVHVYINSRGDRNPDGTIMPPRHAILTRVEVKRDGRWLIVASQATNIVPRATASVAGRSDSRRGQ
jgi:uncharacterized protein (TIGR02246 family)